MSLQLIDHSPDLKRLQDEGYEIEIKGGYLITHHIPYVDKDRCIKYGKLIVALTLNNNIAKYSGNHVIQFMGDFPCHKDGSPISAISHANPNQKLTDDIIMNYSFSNKPPKGIRIIMNRLQGILK